jgi:type II secretory pathway pseudopilin PulG
LEEVLVSIAITGIAIGSIATGYINSAQRAEWAASTAAASSLAQQSIEQARVAKWDTQAYPAVDELVPANFAVVVKALDLPVPGTNVVYATNTTTIATVTGNPFLKMIRSESTWQFMGRRVYTNSIVIYRSPDQ